MVPVVGISVRGAEERELSQEVVLPLRTSRRGDGRRTPSVRPAEHTGITQAVGT